MEYKDYYQTLGVARTATPEEIQKAYRKLARKLHPDVNRGSDAEVRFKEINEAHQVLSDPEKRAKYDQFGSAWEKAQHGPGAQPGFDDFFSQFSGGRPGGFDFGGGGGDFGGSGFSSFFESLFGGGPGGGVRWSTAGPPPKGQDHEARITLTIEEAARGGERHVTIADPQTGSRRSLRVKVPPGVRPGQRIRLGGQGGASRGGGPAGHLYLTVDLARNGRFRLEGDDLHTVVDVAPWEAALGGEVDVPTLHGHAHIKIPAGSSSGRRFRLRGKGFPRRKGEPGDLLAELRIVVPRELSDEDRKRWEELARTSEFKPRGV